MTIYLLVRAGSRFYDRELQTFLPQNNTKIYYSICSKATWWSKLKSWTNNKLWEKINLGVKNHDRIKNRRFNQLKYNKNKIIIIYHLIQLVYLWNQILIYHIIMVYFIIRLEALFIKSKFNSNTSYTWSDILSNFIKELIFYYTH